MPGWPTAATTLSAPGIGRRRQAPVLLVHAVLDLSHRPTAWYGTCRRAESLDRGGAVGPGSKDELRDCLTAYERQRLRKLRAQGGPDLKGRALQAQLLPPE